jgi:hypothetical protein
LLSVLVGIAAAGGQVECRGDVFAFLGAIWFMDFLFVVGFFVGKKMKPMTFESTSVKKSHKPCFFYEKATFS